jgi:hypothetical protein
MQAHTQAHMQAHTHSHARTHPCTHADAHTHAHTHTHARTHARTHTHTQACTHTHTHTHAHTRSHTLTHTHAQTDTNYCTEVPMLSYVLLLLTAHTTNTDTISHLPQLQHCSSGGTSCDFCTHDDVLNNSSCYSKRNDHRSIHSPTNDPP